MGRKLMLTGIMVFVEPDSSIQVAIGCLLNFAMLMASLKIQPLYDPLVDAANNIAFLELYLTLFLGLLFRVSAVSDDAGESELFTLVVAVLGAFIFVYPAVGLMLFSRRSRTTVTPPKSPLVKAVTKTVSGFLNKTVSGFRTPKADAAPAEPKADVQKEEAKHALAPVESLVKAVTKTVSGFLKRTPKPDAAPADEADGPKEVAQHALAPVELSLA
jgi:hypothetical protein